ncbi:hypothetical protein [Martelella sp. AD-3]|uniref:hypothetical protein n=1 Tax=Martelella sp. AD-3 TaxID=686597 RepID=UPI0012681034|nr:hypothetical protein [Martelella sp. AD-3]
MAGNAMLGREMRKGLFGFMDRAAMEGRARLLLDMRGTPFDPSDSAAELARAISALIRSRPAVIAVAGRPIVSGSLPEAVTDTQFPACRERRRYQAAMSLLGEAATTSRSCREQRPSRHLQRAPPTAHVQFAAVWAASHSA